ncbi:DNA polymerase/3'-5' exonuclease PolX [Patescibacteria group bacterium]
MPKRFTNKRIADVLREMSVCYEMEDVSFKPAAYERAADVIERLAEDTADILKRDGQRGLVALPGIGKGIADHIEKLHARGDFREWRDCRRRLPEEALAIVAVPEIGPKKMKALHDRLKIKTLDDLARAARKGQVRELPGFGEKSEQAILKGIALMRRAGQRRLLGRVLPLARELERRCKSLPGVKRAVVAGSLRRRRETVGDFDVVLTAASPKRAMDSFASLPQVKKTLERGDRNIMVRLENGMTCDVIVVPDGSFGAAVQHFTGNKDHNVEIRKLAAERGLKLNEYGLWRGKKRLASRTEREVYRRLGLPYVEPELRTASGEIEAALKGKLPDLLPYGSVRGDLQVQTDWTDGAASVAEMTEAARKAGLEYFAVTDHTRSLAMAGGLDGRKLAAQGREIAKLNDRLKRARRSFTVLSGAETNILKDGRIDIPDASLARLDFVGAAVHASFRLSKREQTERLIRAMRNPHVDAIMHPTARLIHRREPIELDIERLMRAARETRTALEIDAFPERSDLKDTHVRLAVEHGVRLTVSTDAHHPDHFRFIELGEAIARRGWARKRDVLNTRTAASLLKWLRTPKQKRR